MTTFLELSNVIRGLLGLWYVLLMLFACVTSYMFFTLKKYHMSVLSALSTLTCYIFVQWFSDIGICYNKKLVPPHSVNLIDSADWKWLLLIGFFLTILIICTFLNALYWNKNIVSSSALKAGMDNLPSGLCWYYEDGTIALRNSKMENICYLLTGEKLGLGDLFEKALSENMDENNVLLLSDGSVWKIGFNVVEKEKTILHEICAYDITKEYEITQSHIQKKEEAQEVNDNLVRYSRELAQMITANEILAAKVRIHDELGQGLLLTRKYLLRDGSEEEKEKLLYVLHKNCSLMESTQSASGKSYMEMIMEAASDMGVSLIIEGDMPKRESHCDIVTTAIHENLTNTIRHAQGDRMKLSQNNESGKYTAVFTNNGNVPKGPIEERGGLVMLRALVEAAGGSMVIEHEPKYKMTINLFEE